MEPSERPTDNCQEPERIKTGIKKINYEEFKVQIYFNHI